MNFRKLIFSLASLIMPLTASADHCGGKLDAGPVYVHIDVLECGHTIKKLDMAGFKVNGTVMLTENTGFCIKPDILYASGHGELIAGSLALGHVTPINEKLCVTPNAGLSLTNLRTSVNFPFPAPINTIHARERFRSLAPFIAMDVTYKVCDGLRVCGLIQYSWSRTHTRIRKLSEFNLKRTYKGNSCGPSYALMVEKDLSDVLSVHVGGAYNESLSEERHGLRGYGFKLGFARWF